MNVVLGIFTAIVLSLSSSIVPLSTTFNMLPSAFAQTTPPTCEGKIATIVGTSRGENIVGTSGNDVIAALAGNDIVQGNAGDDLICGGSGNDQLYGGDGNDRLIGESGDDELNGDSGTDQLVGSTGTDKANGGAGNDICNAETETSCDEPPQDTTSPVLTVPADITVQATSAAGAVVTFEVTAQDNVDGTATLEEDGTTVTQDNVGGDIRISCDKPSGSTFPVGDTTVNCTATDAAGNEASKSFKVTVTPLPDTTAPTVTVPANIVAQATSAQGAQVTFTVTAQDNVDGTATLDANGLRQDNVGGDIRISCTPASGSTFPVGDTTVNCTATDAAGNTAATPASFKVTVNPITCQGVPTTIIGTNGVDDLAGTDGRDVVALLDGDDLFHGRGGNDLICGDGGNDRLLVGDLGDDEIHGGEGNDGLFGTEDNDSMFGEAGDDTLGDEHVGNDIMSGGAGNDLLDSTDNVQNNDNLDGGDGTQDTCQSDPDIEVNCELD